MEITFDALPRHVAGRHDACPRRRQLAAQVSICDGSRSQLRELAESQLGPSRKAFYRHGCAEDHPPGPSVDHHGTADARVRTDLPHPLVEWTGAFRRILDPMGPAG